MQISHSMSVDGTVKMRKNCATEEKTAHGPGTTHGKVNNDTFFVLLSDKKLRERGKVIFQ